MSIEEHKKIVRRYQEIYNRNDLDALSEVVSEDLLTPKIMPGIPTGIEGAKAAHRIMLTGFPDYQTVIDDLFAEGDKVAARITMSGTNTGSFMGIPPTGKYVSFTGIYIARIANGKIVEHWGEEDGVSLLQQLGVLNM
ncbi:MAG TPA: ester cyclase [Anaerolineales bacterium]|nr:ester cyclase [Anaerolineales bacterium]